MGIKSRAAASAAASAANRLAPVILLTCGLSWLLYLTLSAFGQAQDMMRTVAEDLVHNFFFSMALALFTTTNWCMLALAMRGLAAVPDWLRIALATVLSMVGPAIVAVAYRAPGTVGALLFELTGILVPAGGMAFLMFPAQRQGRPLEWMIMAMSRAWAVCGFAVVIALVASPDFLGLFLGPVTVILVLGVAAMWVVWFLATRAPALSIVLLLLFLWMASRGEFGVRPVRTIADAQPRPSSQDYARRWLESHPGARPVFITSDGGGIRAAYWTAIVLGALIGDAPSFSSHIYAASGVSGGSAGLAVFASTLDEAKAREALSFDFLAAPLTRLLVRDPIDSV